MSSGLVDHEVVLPEKKTLTVQAGAKPLSSLTTFLMPGFHRGKDGFIKSEMSGVGKCPDVESSAFCLVFSSDRKPGQGGFRWTRLEITA